MLGSDWTGLDLTGATIEDIPTVITLLKANYSLIGPLDLSGRNLTSADFNREFSRVIRMSDALDRVSDRGQRSLYRRKADLAKRSEILDRLVRHIADTCFLLWPSDL